MTSSSLADPGIRSILGLYGMVDTGPRPSRSHIDVAKALLAAGSPALQVRMKGVPLAEQAAVLQSIHPLCNQAGAQLIINDHLDLAVRFPGVGLHLGQEDTSPLEARQVLGVGPLIGLSTHSRDQAKAALLVPVDYIGFGPIFSSESKHLEEGDTRQVHRPVGLAALKAVATEATVSVVAIGGIQQETLPLVAATGVEAVAAISAIVAADDMVAAARLFHQAMLRSRSIGEAMKGTR